MSEKMATYISWIIWLFLLGLIIINSELSISVKLTDKNSMTTTDIQMGTDK